MNNNVEVSRKLHWTQKSSGSSNDKEWEEDEERVSRYKIFNKAQMELLAAIKNDTDDKEEENLLSEKPNKQIQTRILPKRTPCNLVDKDGNMIVSKYAFNGTSAMDPK